MAETEQEVFEYFRRDPDKSPAVDALAYASFAFDKYEWMKKFAERAGRPAQTDEIARWIRELPDSRLDEIQQSALSFFRQTVTDYIRQAEEKAFQAGSQDAVVRRVHEATSFWRNLPGNITVGVVSSFAFALLLVIASIVFYRDPSPIALYHRLIAPSSAQTQPK